MQFAKTCCFLEEGDLVDAQAWPRTTMLLLLEFQNPQVRVGCAQVSFLHSMQEDSHMKSKSRH